MSKSGPPYPAEFRRKIVAVVRAGRTPDELSNQFEPPTAFVGALPRPIATRASMRTDSAARSARRLASCAVENPAQACEILAKATAWCASGYYARNKRAPCAR